MTSIQPAGESGFYLRFGEEISEQTFHRVTSVLAALDRCPPPGLVDVMPGFACLLVLFDARRASADEVRAALETVMAAPAELATPPVREVPVLYDPEEALDLTALASEKSLTVDELIARHAAPLYRCHMLGFRPGFPFLGGLDPALASPRLATPRLSVPGGAVGIGGRQTGVYPSAGPGGWRIIGRTPLRLYDPARDQPFLIQAGDHVRFVPIDRARFLQLAGGAGGIGA